MKPLRIIGGGLAGLALGNALADADIPVSIHEAGTIPRHRVCGEFICGKGAQALKNLGLEATLTSSKLHQTTKWFLRDRLVIEANLPKPAVGISRHLLDKLLADRFTASGGELLLNQRYKGEPQIEGTILCHGRQATKSEWIGLKCHCLELETCSDLELHLGRNGYVGLSSIENGRVNVCALFKNRPKLKAKRDQWLTTYLDACGLQSVSKRIHSGAPDAASHVGVAGIQFSSLPTTSDSALRLGDAYSVIPPFTGNGMSIALEAAEYSFEPLVDYTKGASSWEQTVTQLNSLFRECFNPRLRAARILHPWLSKPAGQHTLAALARMNALPFNFLYRITH
ncbi:MAG: NAD(P)/FAD-dependent oxidoreductase [Opitutaceae bacterium]